MQRTFPGAWCLCFGEGTVQNKKNIVESDSVLYVATLYTCMKTVLLGDKQGETKEQQGIS